MGRADGHDPVVAATDEEVHKQAWETAVLARATHMHVNLYMTDWVATQWEDPILKTVINWISNWKVEDLKHLLGDDGNTEEDMVTLWEQKKLMLCQGAFYHHHTPAGELEEAMQFIVPKAHWVATMTRCHRDAGHQGQQQMLYLLQDQFWWPSMTVQIQKAISNCEWCIQQGGTHAKAPMQPIIVICRFHKDWDDYGVGSTTQNGEHFGLLWPLYKICHGICDSWSNCKDCC